MTTYQTHRVTTVTRKPDGKSSQATKGMIEIIGEPTGGMALIDACVPIAMAARIISLGESAGLTIRYPDSE